MSEDYANLTLSRHQQRLLDTSTAIRGGPPDRIDFLHTVQCQCGIPYKNPGDDVREWDRTQGHVSLRIEAGSAIDPRTGNFVKLGLPYGEKPRLVLIHRLYEALRTCDMEVETTIALVHAVAQAIGPALPKEKRYSATELDRALGAVKSRYRSIMKNARIVHYLFAYQEVSDEELDQYVTFLETENGKWLIALVDKGFFDAAESISRGLRTDIPRKVKPRRRLPGENTAKGLLP